MATDPIPDPITTMYERVHNEWSADRGRHDDPPAPPLRTGGNSMLAVAALLAEVALRYDDLDRRLRALEDRLTDSPD